LNAVARAADAELRPLFSEARELRAEAARFRAETGVELPDLSVYLHALVPEADLTARRERLLRLDAVVGAYVKPSAEPAVVLGPAPRLTADPPGTTPDFTSRQGYLDRAPSGVDARYAWNITGGSGTGVHIIDVEREWRLSHEDLREHQGGVIGGHPPDDLMPRNHGTAVLGVIGGNRNVFGVTGVSPEADMSCASVMFESPLFGLVENTSRGIWLGARALGPGDILLLELHRPGPRFGFRHREDQRGFIAVEWWPCDFAAILYATYRGVLVVEAAGNGEEDLNDPIYDTPANDFPPTWVNPFRRGPLDAGAILVGAGAPPPGTHNHDWGPDRSRLGFSNFGAIVDAQSWGREVTTSGYGDLQGGTNEDRWYTNQFGGTSSASPVVAGALACVQGSLATARRPLLTPATARHALRATGSSQQVDYGRPLSQRIGNRPDLRQLIAFAKGG